MLLAGGHDILTPIVHCSLGTFLACTEHGKASIRPITKENAASGSHIEPSATWDVCGGANVQFCSVDHGENYVMFGG
jgi:ribosome biogenesis protein NSA1